MVGQDFVVRMLGVKWLAPNRYSFGLLVLPNWVGGCSCHNNCTYLLIKVLRNLLVVNLVCFLSLLWPVWMGGRSGFYYWDVGSEIVRT